MIITQYTGRPAPSCRWWSKRGPCGVHNMGRDSRHQHQHICTYNSIVSVMLGLLIGPTGGFTSRLSWRSTTFCARRYDQATRTATIVVSCEYPPRTRAPRLGCCAKQHSSSNVSKRQRCCQATYTTLRRKDIAAGDRLRERSNEAESGRACCACAVSKRIGTRQDERHYGVILIVVGVAVRPSQLNGGVLLARRGADGFELIHPAT